MPRNLSAETRQHKHTLRAGLEAAEECGTGTETRSKSLFGQVRSIYGVRYATVEALRGVAPKAYARKENAQRKGGWKERR